MPPYNANGQRNPYGANPYGSNPYDPNQYPQQGNMPYLPNLDLNDPRQNPDTAIGMPMRSCLSCLPC